ncbi:hypothetical protein CO058_04285 [candidate division WWE3 bacterium CG_4_9_14_0_2_um_filter_35_11]|uniref:histidine kinase n=1 Tax=candidate division WWE3 bacterium CG_4_9_14_0_2_um_filter_35_11 TaxID=1975077 RepID=A0A2M8EKQ4_UNCKA|nr:MAG: hypothetical protein COV25_01190 [candidate division WWE3 bacterium CG10_big_fil_rev_8_21_14_0_10_35_32]PJC23295.1 MAG: hypothetical protein CO058_04285 [candidate division WWE3 bacterium CG_4_9_14_0_2_um_filter_35_11]
MSGNEQIALEVKTLESLWKLEKTILNTLDYTEVIQKVVDSILTELNYLERGYKVVVLVLLDQEKQVLRRTALSQTEEAKKTREVSNLRFEDIATPMTATRNLCVKAIIDNKPQITTYFPDILTPPVTPGNALESQRNAGIKASMVYPLNVSEKPIGVMIFSMTKREDEVADEEKLLLQHFTDLVALAVKNSKLYSDLQEQKLQLVQTNKTLIQSNKIKDDFISVASHELRTPMSIIKSNLWMLINPKTGDLNENQKNYINRSSQATERMLKLVNEMLDISKIESGKKLELKKEEIKICNLIDEILADFKLTVDQKGLKLNLSLCDVNDVVYGDIDKLREIITNLVGNSIKYTDSGEVSVKVENIDHKYIKISISDTGKGIEKDNLKKLFRKFERLENSFQEVAEAGGTGLGLYIVKLLVEAMGGEVGASSEGLGKGSTFWFTLPLIRKPNNSISKIID